MLVAVALLACACRSDGDTKDAAGTRASAAKVALLLGFDRAKPGTPPAGFTARSGQWRVVEDPTAPSTPCVLAQTGAQDESAFNLVLQDDFKGADVELAVALRAVAGEIDQGGGLVWRAKDERNYYLARWNPLERNLRMYEVVDGERHQLASETVRADPGWHELKVSMRGDQMRCSLDGRASITARDGSFLAPGKIGLWTKADAVTHFDELSIKSGDR
jgi:hypothetical protein